MTVLYRTVLSSIYDKYVTVLHKTVLSSMYHKYSRREQIAASDLRVYDPYYCDGAVVSHFKELGFPNVANENTDCYKVVHYL